MTGTLALHPSFVTFKGACGKLWKMDEFRDNMAAVTSKTAPETTKGIIDRPSNHLVDQTVEKLMKPQSRHTFGVGFSEHRY